MNSTVQTYKHYLIIRLSALGDILLTTPIIRCLKKQQPDCKISFLIKEKNQSILKSNPYIDHIIIFKGKLNETLKEIRQSNVEFIIDLHNNLRSSIIKQQLNIPAASFPKLNTQKFIFTLTKKNYLPDLHIVDRYFQTVKQLNIQNDQEGLDFFIHPENEINLERYQLQKHKYYCIAIGAKHFTKQIPSEKIIQLIRRLNSKIVLLGDKNDSSKAEIIQQHSNENVINCCGKLNIEQSASLIQQSKAIITPDSLLMHLGAALGIPVYSVWGNTVPEFGMYPYAPKSPEIVNIFENKDISCRPCSKIGFKECPKGHFKCMNELKMSDLSEIIQKDG